MIISIVNSKGGVGKTTISVHVAAWLREQGISVAAVDADEQASATDWLREAAPDIPVYPQLTSREILEGVPALAQQYDAVVADGPAALSARIAALGSVADLVVMPLQPSMLDIWASYRTARMVYKLRFRSKRKDRPHALTVLNRARARTRLGRLAAVAVQKYGFPVSPVVLESRTPYAEACANASFVWRLGKRAALATAEVARLCEFMLLQMPESETASMLLARRKALEATRQVMAAASADERSILAKQSPKPVSTGPTRSPPASADPVSTPGAESGAFRSTG